MRNHKYAKVMPDGQIEYAENIIRGKFGVILNPTERQYAINGFFLVEDKMPPPKPDCRWVRDKYVLKNNKVVAIYKATDAVIYQNCNKVVKLNPFRRLVRAIVYWAAGK